MVMPNLGQGAGFYPREFTERETVPIRKLIGTNRNGYLNLAKHKGNGTVYVLKKGGRYYIADGHHTVGHALAKGKTNIACRVKTL